MMEVKTKVCKKCKRELPVDYKFSLCESCRNKKVDVAKKVGGAVLFVASTVIGIKAKGKNN